MHVIHAPLCTLPFDDVSFDLNEEHDGVFLQVEQTLTHNCELTIPNTKNPFFIEVDASAVGVSTILVQAADKGEMQVMFYISRIFTESGQKLP